MRLPVDQTLQRLLQQEDTDHDQRITVRDQGPKRFDAGGLVVEGTYALSNLLQDLAVAQQAGQPFLETDLATLNQNPVERISSAICNRYWSGLTRRLDGDSLLKVLSDPKGDGRLRLYLSARDAVAQGYYQKLHRTLDFELLILPKTITPEYVLGLNSAPGLLGLAMGDAQQPIPYVVPGGRFNEMYGWDSYFIGLGLVQDGQVELARGMVKHQLYEIEHYGQILNANRTYYLTRSQPPFLTQFLHAVGMHADRRGLDLAAREYQEVWMHPTRLTDCGLSRYFCSGIGFPPESMMRHYGQTLRPFAEAAGVSVEEYRKLYQARKVAPPELDAYFREDRSVRESGHDTSYRLEGISTQLCPVDLNSLLYKYEVDLGWHDKAAQRKELMRRLCWSEKDGQFFDYNWTTRSQTGFVSATNFFPLWAGLASVEQAARMVESLQQLVEKGGVAGTTAKSRGPLGPERTPRQWDYPYGWAPHQMLLWRGLKDYGYDRVAADLALRWLRMIVRNAVDFNGVIPEKYDVVACSHEVFAEYTNVGSEFKFVPTEGFGWTNASFQVGLNYLDAAGRRELESIR